MYKVIRKGTLPVMEQRMNDGMEYLVFPELEKTGIVSHLFSTRLGGVSRGCYGESNFSYTRGDLREAVDENYRRVAQILGHGRTLDDFVSTYQTHTTNVRLVTEEDRGKGTVRQRDYTDTDGLITDVPGIILVTYHADCTPLYFVDPVHRAIGLSHSGWKGTAGRMGQKTLEAMNRAFGTRPEDCICGIGPSICGDCYEIGEDVAQIFRDSFADTDLLQKQILRAKGNGKYLLNLWQANRMILENAGVPSAQISVTDICTCCNPEYLFSHRKAHEKRGNLAAFLTLK
jgi:YfiH family protein